MTADGRWNGHARTVITPTPQFISTEQSPIRRAPSSDGPDFLAPGGRGPCQIVAATILPGPRLSVAGAGTTTTVIRAPKLHDLRIRNLRKWVCCALRFASFGSVVNGYRNDNQQSKYRSAVSPPPKKKPTRTAVAPEKRFAADLI
jgi:hypothetical protein